MRQGAKDAKGGWWILALATLYLLYKERQEKKREREAYVMKGLPGGKDTSQKDLAILKKLRRQLRVYASKMSPNDEARQSEKLDKAETLLNQGDFDRARTIFVNVSQFLDQRIGRLRDSQLTAADAKLLHKVIDAAMGKWKKGSNGWEYFLDNWLCGQTWEDKGTWFGMGDSGTRKKFKTEEEAKRYVEQVAPANRERIRKEHGK
jgi:hypothetical protein